MASSNSFGGGARDDAHQRFDGVVDRRADGARGAVDLLERRGYLLQEQDGTLGGQHLILAGDLLDL